MQPKNQAYLAGYETAAGHCCFAAEQSITWTNLPTDWTLTVSNRELIKHLNREHGKTIWQYPVTAAAGVEKDGNTCGHYQQEAITGDRLHAADENSRPCRSG